MSKTILITTGDLRLRGALNESVTAVEFAELLPMDLTMSRWGEEYYGDCGIDAQLTPDAKDEMDIGEIAIWPVGSALCFFFGPTPASTGDEPRAASAVNPIGRIIDDTAPLKKLGGSIRVRIT
ncbi:MAG: cyclophilin-like fold protein [Nitrospirota bacterium]|uniref:Cyclophilin TM1367-like domain-containing protein n=1 Tax=Candidatus Magnetominusculus xianensis TaxID=1748249 RepID=A0ABR5SIC9_9BACT|nr:cyclophilin-like fold protein [Candidatus Magnetominusculus xianensis]KWT92170.1 hypothetical protein ASN18_0574 [Candidatus Magnetominusculus xianensis]MBF0404659.1 hypothetical protein [Nitrospirota bacterium]